MIDTLLNLQPFSLTVFFIYLMPMLFCITFYGIVSVQDYLYDKRNSVSGRTYWPRLTVGAILGRSVASTVPILNIICIIFEVVPVLFGDFFNWCGEVLERPIVSQKSK